jgi:hypothetical protein
MIRQLLVAALFTTTTTNIAFAGSIDRAQDVFAQYGKREAAFDSAVADLYSDTALIKNKRTYPTGQVREVTFPAAQYKFLIRSAMPLAKAKGDYSTYSNVTFSEEGQNIRVKATRYSVLKKYSSPLSLLIGSNGQGQWLILEELGESQP